MNRNLFKNPKFYITVVFFGLLGSMLIFDFSQIERMSIFIVVLSGILLITFLSWLNLMKKIHELEEAVYYADFITHFISSDKIEKLEDIGIYGTANTLRIAKKHFSEVENRSIISELKQL